MHEVAVVILNWNGVELLREFLPSVIQNSGDAHIIVADNASTDSSVEFLKTNYPEVEVIVNDENGGYAKGYNDALKRIKAKYYVLLNSDVEVGTGWLDPLLATMNDESVAACQPKIKSYRNKTSFEHAGACGGYLDKYYFPFCRGRIISTVEQDSGQYDETSEIFWASGAALCIRADLFHASGGFDEDFFAHMEEIDLCWRLKRKGYKIMAVPDSTVYHLGGATLSYLSPHKVYLNFRNNLLMIVKNHEGVLLPKLFSRMCIDGIAALRFLLIGEFRQFSAVFRAHMWIYAHLGTNLKKRKQLKKEATTFNRSGLFNGVIVWQFYVRKIRSFSELNQRLFK